MGATSAATTTALIFCHILASVPSHLAEYLECGLAKSFRSHFGGIVRHDNHCPNRLFYRRHHPKKQRSQNPATLIAVNRIAVFLFCQKAETTKTVRTVNPLHRQRWRADKLSLDGYLPVSGLRRQPIRTQSGYKPASVLLLINGIANGQALATLGTTTAQNSAAPTIFHTGHETLLVDTLTIVRLECSFHCLNLCKKAIFWNSNLVKSPYKSRG